MNCFQTFSIKKPEMYIGTGRYILYKMSISLSFGFECSRLDSTIVAELNVTFTIAHKFATTYIQSVQKNIHASFVTASCLSLTGKKRGNPFIHTYERLNR